MSAELLVQVGLMAFVLLAPTVMVAVLVSGLSRRADAAVEPIAVEPIAAESAAPAPARAA